MTSVDEIDLMDGPLKLNPQFAAMMSSAEVAFAEKMTSAERSLVCATMKSARRCAEFKSAEELHAYEWSTGYFRAVEIASEFDLQRRRDALEVAELRASAVRIAEKTAARSLQSFKSQQRLKAFRMSLTDQQYASSDKGLKEAEAFDKAAKLDKAVHRAEDHVIVKSEVRDVSRASAAYDEEAKCTRAELIAAIESLKQKHRQEADDAAYSAFLNAIREMMASAARKCSTAHDAQQQRALRNKAETRVAQASELRSATQNYHFSFLVLRGVIILGAAFLACQLVALLAFQRNSRGGAAYLVRTATTNLAQHLPSPVATKPYITSVDVELKTAEEYPFSYFLESYNSNNISTVQLLHHQQEYSGFSASARQRGVIVAGNYEMVWATRGETPADSQRDMPKRVYVMSAVDLDQARASPKITDANESSLKPRADHIDISTIETSVQLCRKAKRCIPARSYIDWVNTMVQQLSSVGAEIVKALAIGVNFEHIIEMSRVGMRFCTRQQTD
jgi:hypothetical protein